MLWHSDSQLFDMDEVLVLGDGLALLKETGDMWLHRLTMLCFASSIVLPLLKQPGKVGLYAE
jgi:hypothetical protein